MATISMSDLKKGLRIELDGVPYRITEYQHVKPGKGAAFVRTKIKSLLNGRVIEKTFHAGDKAEVPNLENKTMQYLYNDGEFYQFMDTTTFEQIGLTEDQVSDVVDYMLETMEVDVLFFNGKPISIELPQVVELKVVDTPLETGAVVNVPFHILEGDMIRVDTKEGVYLEKAK